LNNPEHISAVIDRVFNSLTIRDILFSCEKLKKRVKSILNSKQFRAVCLRLDIIKLSAGMLEDIDRELLTDIIERMFEEIENIIKRKNNVSYK